MIEKMHKKLSGQQLESIILHENEFINIIHERLGIVIHKHQKVELYKAIAYACEQWNCSPQEYLNKLIRNTQDSPIYEQLITRITIGESYFFRDKSQMQLLEKKILPALIKKKRENNHLALHIWSAGCSSGEEIYTISMLLDQLLPDIDKWTLTLLGTDINTQSLKKALNGLYSEWSMRTIPQKFKELYFLEKKQTYQLIERIKNRVQFSYLNLNDYSYPSIYNETNAQDLILCRNVLIYFDIKNVKKVIHQLGASLAPDGYLLLGASDPIITPDKNIVWHFEEGSYYQKSTITQVTPQKILPVTPPIKTTPMTIPAINKTTTTTKNTTTKPPSTPTNVSTADKTLSNMLNNSEYTEALRYIESHYANLTPTAFMLCAKAIAYANLGKLELAIQSCQESLMLDSTNLLSYFTLAMAELEMNHYKEAENALRKVLFLDNNNILAHYQLGLLLLRNKQHTSGIKSLKNALVLVKKMDPTHAVINFNQLNYGKLSHILENEIKLHSSGSG